MLNTENSKNILLTYDARKPPTFFYDLQHAEYKKLTRNINELGERPREKGWGIHAEAKSLTIFRGKRLRTRGGRYNLDDNRRDSPKVPAVSGDVVCTRLVYSGLAVVEFRAVSSVWQPAGAAALSIRIVTSRSSNSNDARCCCCRCCCCDWPDAVAPTETGDCICIESKGGGRHRRTSKLHVDYG